MVTAGDKTRWLTAVFLALGALHGQAEAASVQPCGPNCAKSGRSLRVNGSDIVLRSGPSEASEKRINVKASKALGTTEYLKIDNSVTVVEECTQDGWSRVRVTEPDWLRNTHIGWVPSSALREPKKDARGGVVFTEADFNWDKETTPHKKTIIAGVNKIHKQHSGCKAIDPSSVFISSDEGTPLDPVFCVTCGSGVEAFNVSFSKSDVEKGTSMAVPARITRDQAISLCEQYAKANATHPSTVSFSRVVDLAVIDHPNGRTTVTSSFTAKNSFNLKLKYNIRCLCDGKGLVEANIAEAQ